MRGYMVLAACGLAMIGAAASAQWQDQPYGDGRWNNGGPGDGRWNNGGPDDGRWNNGGPDNGRWDNGNDRGWSDNDRNWGGSWETIGEKRVDSAYDRDHLRVRGDDRFRKIRICSVDRPIELDSLSVEFHDGERQQFPVRMVLRRGDCSPSFDLEGGRRHMVDVWLSYSKFRPGGEPRVIIQAK